MPEIPVTKNYAQLKKGIESGQRYLLFEGSSGSSKTFSIMQGAVEYCLSNAGKVWTTFRNDRATCHDSVVKDFKIVMSEQFGIWGMGAWNVQNLEYTFRNGSKLQFRGANDPAKLHGPRRTVAHFNEVMEINKDAFDQVDARSSEFVVCDWNPSLNHHWIFDTIIGSGQEFYTHSTFRDNPFQPEASKRAILSWEPTAENKKRGTADDWKWTVYGLGKRGRKEGAIFKVWDVTDDWPNRFNCQRWGYGLDYGFSQDPTALVECALFQDTLYLREHLYKTGLVAQENPMEPSIPSIEGHLREMQVAPDSRIHDDNARPEITQALRNSGFKIISTKKGAGSVLAGIDRLRSLPIKVHRSSHNLQMEMESYSWDKNAQGEYLDVPEDKNNHLIDAARYWAMAELQPLRKPRVGRKRPKAKAKSSLKQWR